jgi:TetR/AcrR family transcriptional regulator, tetracycline repressor protein
VAEKLNRDVIAQAGLRLLDATGIEGITMRALAAELGVQAPTLYWHVKSKRDIFRAMAVAITRDASALVTAADRGAPWQDRLISWARALRRSILSHRDGARVFAGTFAPEPATFDVTESALQALRDAGLSVADAAQRTILLRHFIVGFCIEEQELAQLRVGQDQARRDELKTAADPARFPLTAQALPGMLNTAAEDRFELGVQLMLSGIAGTRAVGKLMGDRAKTRLIESAR